MAANNQDGGFASGLSFGIQESNEMSSAEIFNLLEEDEKVDPKKLEKATKENPLDKKKKKKEETLESAEDDTPEIPTNEDPEEEINLLDKLEEAEEEEEEEEEEPASEEEEEEVPQNPFSTIAKQLFEIGIFTQDEDEEIDIEDGEALRDRFEYEKKKGVTQVLENFLTRKGEDYKNMFDAVFVNGVSPREYLQTYSDLTDFKNADLEQESVQKQVIIEGMRFQGFDEEDIKDELTKAEQYGDLEDKARKYHKVVLKKQEEKLKDLQEKEQLKTQEEIRKENYYKESVGKILTKKLAEKEFDSIPVTQEMAQATMDYISTKKWKTPSGKLITDFDKEMLELDEPENYETKVKIGLLLTLLKKDPKLTSLQRKAISKESNKVFSELAEKTIKKNNTAVKKPTPWFNK